MKYEDMDLPDLETSYKEICGEIRRRARERFDGLLFGTLTIENMSLGTCLELLKRCR